MCTLDVSLALLTDEMNLALQGGSVQKELVRAASAHVARYEVRVRSQDGRRLLVKVDAPHCCYVVNVIVVAPIDNRCYVITGVHGKSLVK